MGVEATIAILDDAVFEQVVLLADHHVDRTPVTTDRLRFGRGEQDRRRRLSDRADRPLREDFMFPDPIAVAVIPGEADCRPGANFQRHPGSDRQDSVYQNFTLPDRVFDQGLFP